jgi:ribosome assembly protein SQT1
MVFTPPAWVPTLPEVPDTVPICDFMFDEQYGRTLFATSVDSYTCGVSGKSMRPLEQSAHVNFLARSLARELEWNVNEGSEYDKVACVFALNTVCYTTRAVLYIIVNVSILT